MACLFSLDILSHPPKMPSRKQVEPRPTPVAEPINPAAIIGRPRLKRDLSDCFIAGKSLASCFQTRQISASAQVFITRSFVNPTVGS